MDMELFDDISEEKSFSGFGQYWALMNIGNKDALPSLFQIVEGLYQLHIENLTHLFGDKSPKE